MYKHKITALVLLPLMVLAVFLLTSCLQPRIGFQGKLTDSGGNTAVADGAYTMTVRFWNNDTGGTSVFTETKQVSVEDGLFTTDIDDFPPHIFSGEVLGVEDTLYMEVTINGETLTPRKEVPGAPYAHALVAGSGVVGNRPNAANVTDDGFDAALTVINGEPTNPGYGIRAQAGSAALYADNVYGDGSMSGQSDSPEDNPDIILGGYYVSDVGGTLSLDDDGGPGVIASDPSINSDIYIRSNDELYLYKNYDGSGSSEFRIYADGNTDPQARLDDDGNWSVDGTHTGGGADYAELIDMEEAEASYEPGDVLVISDEVDRAVELSTETYSSLVIGVYSTKPGFLGSTRTVEDGLAATGDDGAIEVAIAGIVPVKVSAENGPIQRGDLLTTASIPGHAMKATELTIGTILGKAMGTLESGTSVIEMLVMLQ